MTILKNSVVTRQRGAKSRGFKTISTYIYGSILEYINGILTYTKGI
jgi:hypothetical protein